MKKFIMILTLLAIAAMAFAQTAGSTVANPMVFSTLPISYSDNTELYLNDYTSAMIAPTSSYLNGYDFVAQFTLTQRSSLSGSVSGSWTGVFIVNQEPSLATPANVFAVGSGSNGGSFNNPDLQAGTYYAIVSTYPTPNYTDFTLNISASAWVDPTIVNFPTSYDFGTTSSDAFPPLDWTRYSGVLADPTIMGAEGSGYWRQDDWRNITSPANKAARLEIYSTWNGWLISPPIAVPGNDYEVMFDVAYMYYSSNNPPNTTGVDDKFAVLVGDGTSWTTANVVRQWDNAGSPYILNNIPPAGMTVSLPLGAAGTKYVAFYAGSTISNADNDLMVDNITFRQTPSNPIFSLSPNITSWDFGQTIINTNATKQFTITNTGGGTMTLSSVVASGTYYSISEAPTDMNLTAGESTTFTVQYLPTMAGDPHTATVTIAHNVGADIVIDLSGSCYDPTVTSFPWTENFDTVTVPNLPLGWTSIDNNGDGDAWASYGSNAHSSPNAMMIYTDYNDENDDYLVTPPLALTGNQRLKFWTRSQSTNANDIDEISILLSTTTPTAAAFTNVLMPSTLINSTTYAEYEVDLSAYSGTCYISFTRKDEPADGWRLYVDDVRVEDIPLTPIISVNPETWDYDTQIINTTTPKEFTITNIGVGSLDINSLTVTGTGFALTEAFTSDPLLENESVSFTVNFTPVAEGTYSGNIAINDNRGLTNIPLNGTALDATIYAGDLPHIENFDAVTAPAFPLGWEGVINSTNTFVRVETYTSSTPYSAPNHVHIYNSGDATADLILVSPPVDVALNTLRTKFMAKGGSSYSLDVGTWDGTTFTLYENLLIPANYAMYSVNFSGYTGSDNRIAFRHGQGSTYRSIYIDDVVIEIPAPIAPEPATVLFPADGITTLLNPMLQWTPSPTGEPVTSFKVYLNQGGIFSEDDLVYEGADLQFQTTGLTYAQTYYWKVLPTSIFGSDPTCPTWTFNTPGADQLAEGFEATTFPPLGWANGSTGNWTRSTSTPKFEGDASAYKFTSTTTEYVISTSMLTIDGSSTIDFYTRASATSQVLQMVSSVDRTTWTPIGTDITYEATGIWYPVSIDLSILAGSSYYIGFQTPIHTTTGSIYVDHVVGPQLTPVLPGIPTLTAPANAAVNQGLTPTLTWTAATTGGIPAEFKIYLDTVDGSTLFDTSLTNTYTVTPALNWDTTYYWKVAASNNAGIGEASDVRSFTTMSDPTIYTLPFDEGFEEGHINATAIAGWMQEGTTGTNSWTANNTLIDYNRSPRTGDWNAYLRYGSAQWMFKPVQLNAGTLYRVMVYARQDGAGADNASIGISYGAEPSVDGMTGTILAPTGIIDGDYQRLEGVFTPDTAGIYYVGIFGEINFTPWYISIDDIRIDEAPTGAPDPVTLLSPADEATGLSIDGFNLTWAQAMTGGYPETYAVLMSMNEGDLSNGHYWDGITDTSFDPTQAELNPIAYEYGETWYWTVIALNEDGDALQETASSFTIMDDPRILSLPYSENFDAVPTPDLPVAWTGYKSNNSSSLYTSTTYAVSSPNNVYMYAYTASETMRLITPEVLVPMNSIKLSFSARGSSGYTLLVGTVDALDETGTFTQLESIDLSANHEIYSVSFASYAGTDQNICFQHGLGGTYRSIYIDDVAMDELVANDLAVVSLTGHDYGFQNTDVTHTVTVKNNGTSTQNSYTVYLKSVDGRIVLASETINEELLPEATKAIEFTWAPSALGALEIYGEVVLAGDVVPVNNVSDIMAFNTYQEGILMEGFEDGVIPANWTVINADGGTQVWNAQTANPHTGSYSARVRYESSSLDNDDWLITPPLQVTSSTTDNISFWMRTYNATSDDAWQVLISTTDTNPASFTMIDEGTGQLAEYVQKSYNLDSYGNAVVYLAVRYMGSYDWYLYVDDFVGPPIYVPTSLAQPVLSVSTSGNNVVLDWEAIPYASSYQIEAADAPEGPYTLLTTVTGNTYSTSATSKKFFKVIASTEGIRAMTQQPLSLEQQLLKDEADRISNGKN